MTKGKISILPYKNFFEILNAIPPHYSINDHPLIVRCDMHNSFVSVAKEMFPRAIICIDIFHVIKHLNECVSSIRVQLQRDLDPSDPNYRLLKGSMRMLVAKESGIDSKYDQKAPVVRKRIDKLLKAYPDLNEAYQALQCFHYINAMTIPALQRAQLTEWLEVYCSSEVPFSHAVPHSLSPIRQRSSNVTTQRK